jgi:hypothetical protein
LPSKPRREHAADANLQGAMSPVPEIDGLRNFHVFDFAINGVMS